MSFEAGLISKVNILTIAQVTLSIYFWIYEYLPLNECIWVRFFVTTKLYFFLSKHNVEINNIGLQNESWKFLCPKLYFVNNEQQHLPPSFNVDCKLKLN